MNKSILVVLIIVIGGIGFWFWQKQTSSVKDCGTDTGCFAANFKSCTPSKIYGGTTEIKGGSSEACNVYFESDNPSFENGELKHERVTMECTVKNTNLFKDEEMNAVGVYEKGSVCSGSLYDIYVKIHNSVQEE